MPKWNHATVSDIIDETPTVKRFLLETKDKHEFIPGQFITIDLPISEKRTKRWRSYSIANAPSDEHNLLELCIVRVPEGLATQHLWEETKIGDEIKFKDPAGTFTLPKNLNRDIIMVCTGTGVAPFRSMIKEIINQDIAFDHIHLIYGSRREEDILYRDEFDSWAQKLPNFHYDIALSREPQWSGYKGYVHQVYMDRYAESNPDRLFMICGWSAMIDDAVANLLIKMPYDKSQVIYELYG